MIRSFAIAALILFTLGGCKEGAVIDDPVRIAAMQAELDQATFDLSQVTVARLKIDGRPMEVVSITPVVVGFAKVGGVMAKTIFRFSDKRDALILFTRDQKNGKAYRLDLPVQEIVAGKTLKFPVLRPNGDLVEQTLVFEALITR
jgi:hypothetical protein